MSAGEVHVGDIGTVFQITVMDDGAIVDISGASVKNIIFKRPDKILVTKSMSFVGTGTDGKVKYTTIQGDLAVAGDWQLQVAITLPSGSWRSDLHALCVYPNLTTDVRVLIGTAVLTAFPQSGTIRRS